LEEDEKEIEIFGAKNFEGFLREGSGVSEELQASQINQIKKNYLEAEFRDNLGPSFPIHQGNLRFLVKN
jgi:hypothetical protein